MIDLDGIKARLARVWGKWPAKGVLAPGADELGPKAWSAHGPLRCHATEQGRARQWTQANADADFIAAAPADIGALVAEVELLRTGRDVSRAYADRLDAEALVLRGERAAVVAWLRAEANEPHPIEAGERALSPSGRGLLLLAASRIERGEHRREGGK